MLISPVSIYVPSLKGKYIGDAEISKHFVSFAKSGCFYIGADTNFLSTNRHQYLTISYLMLS